MADRRPTGAAAPPAQRIDVFLWYARLAPSRSDARMLAERGIVRLNGRRIDRAHAAVRPDDIVTLPQGQAVRAVRILALPGRRGPATEAQMLYEMLTTGEAPQDHIRIDAAPDRE